MFNLDLHSPSPNALYRQSHSVEKPGACPAKESPEVVVKKTSTRPLPSHKVIVSSNSAHINSESESGPSQQFGKRVTRNSSRSRIITPGLDSEYEESIRPGAKEDVFSRLSGNRSSRRQGDGAMASKVGSAGIVSR